MPKITHGLWRDIHEAYMDYLKDVRVPAVTELEYLERFKDLLNRVDSECAASERDKMRYEDCILPEDFMEGYDEVEDTVEDDEPFAEDMIDSDWKVYESTIPKEEGLKGSDWKTFLGLMYPKEEDKTFSSKTPKRVTIIEY